MNNNAPRYPIASLNTHPTMERAIDTMNGYIFRYKGYTHIINSNPVFLNLLKEYIEINNILPNRKTKGKDELRSRMTDALVEMKIYNEIEVKWLRYHDYFELFIQMLQNSNTVSNILSSKDKVN